MTLSVSRLKSVRSYEYNKMGKGSEGRLRHHSGIWLDELRETTNDLNQDSCCPGLDFPKTGYWSQNLRSKFIIAWDA
jgi:hypothetical protein